MYKDPSYNIFNATSYVIMFKAVDKAKAIRFFVNEFLNNIMCVIVRTFWLFNI